MTTEVASSFKCRERWRQWERRICFSAMEGRGLESIPGRSGRTFLFQTGQLSVLFSVSLPSRSYRSRLAPAHSARSAWSCWRTEVISTIRLCRCDNDRVLCVVTFAHSGLVCYEYEIVECCFTSTLRNRRLISIRDGSPGRPPRLSHSSWALRVRECAARHITMHVQLISSGPMPPFSILTHARFAF